MNTKYLSLVFLLCLLIPGFLNAQKDSVRFVSMVSKENLIEITFSSEKGFIIGAERYVLHVGDACITRSRHPEGDKKRISFVLDSDAFSALKDNEEMVLVYGLFDENLKSVKSAENRKYVGRHWKAGLLNKDILNK